MPRTRITPKDAVPVSPFRAFHEVVHAYGVRQLADVLGMRAGTLWNKADADVDVDSHHQPTLRDVIAVTRQTQDLRVVESLNRLFDRASFSLVSGPVSDEALLELLNRIGSEKGQMHQALARGLADKRFCREDFHEVRGEAYDLISAVLNFVVRLEGLVDD